MGRTITVTLGDYYDALVRAYVESGRYKSISEVVRAGLRQLEELDEDFTKKLDVNSPSKKYRERLEHWEFSNKEFEEIQRSVIAELREEGKNEEADAAEREWFGNKEQ